MIVGGDSTRPSDYLERVQDLVEMDEVTKGLAWWEGTRIAEDSVLRTPYSFPVADPGNAAEMQDDDCPILCSMKTKAAVTVHVSSDC